MHRHCIQKMVSVLLLLLILLPLLPAIPASAESEAYYGEAYKDLQKEEHRIAYKLMEEGIAGLSPSIQLQGHVNINYKEMMKVIRAVCVDHPQYFWFLEEGRFVYNNENDDNYIVSFEPKYVLDGERVSIGSQKLLDAVFAFHTKVQQIIGGIPMNYTTDYEIALYLHDYLAEHITYTLEGDHPSAYAALIRGEAACYGYSKAYQCLLNAVGIRARTITGDSPDENGNLSGHAWNQIWLDGECYYADVTWDDFEDVTMHGYFAISLEKISADHIAEPEFILPECGHETINFYYHSRGIGVADAKSTTTAAQLAPRFRLDSFDSQEAVFGCEIRYNDGNFFGWFDKIYGDLWRRMGLSNQAAVYYYQMENVYYLQLVDPGYSGNFPPVSAIGLNAGSVSMPSAGTRYQLRPNVEAEGDWIPNLLYTSSDPSVVSVDKWGLVTAISEGTAIISASSRDGTVSAECEFTVQPQPPHNHTMRMFTTKQATCTQDGHETYYLCTDCGRRFADEAGTIEHTNTESFVLPASGHVELSWVKRFDYHQQECQCGEEISGTRANHLDDSGDKLCDVCGLEMMVSTPTLPKPTPDEKINGGWVYALTAVIPVGIAAFFVIRRIRRRH